MVKLGRALISCLMLQNYHPFSACRKVFGEPQQWLDETGFLAVIFSGLPDKPYRFPDKTP
jgi:hypothetical protein